MLPTLGLFRAFPCPYFVVGLCERPHCSFRHSRSDVEAARRQASGQESSAGNYGVNHEETTTEGSEDKGKSPARSPVKGQLPSTTEALSDLLTRGDAKGTDGSPSAITSSPSKSSSSGRRLSRKEKRDSESSVFEEDESDRKKLKLEASVPGNCGGSDGSGKDSKSKSRKDHSNRKSSSSSSKSNSKKDGSHKIKSSTSSDKSEDKHRKHHKDKKESKESDRTSSGHRSSRSHRSDSSSSSKHSDANLSKKLNGHSSASKSSSHKSKHADKSKAGAESDTGSPSKLRSKSESEPLREVKKSLASNVFNGEVVTLDDDDIQTTMENDFDDVRDNFLCPSDEDDDAEEIALECFTLFKQYNKDDKVTSAYNLETLPEAKPFSSETEPTIQVGKKRVAHDGAEKPSLIKPSVAVPPKRKESLSEQLQRRFQAAQEAIASQPPPPPCPPEAVPISAASKKRIAHVTNISALVKPPPKPSNNAPVPNGSKPTIPATLCQTATKGEKRVAHVPMKILSATTGSAPTVVPDSRSKIPLLVRQKFMDQIFRECVQIYNDGDSARMRALEEEKSLVSKCSSKQVYTCSAVNLITRLRKEYRETSSETPGGSITSGTTRTVSHNEILAGKAGSSISWSIEKKAVYRPVGVQLYSKMAEYLLSMTELEDHGFPVKCPVSFKGCTGLAIIKPRDDAASKRGTDDEYRKTCDRCGASFTIDDEGFPKTKEPCVYHSGRKFGRRTRTGNAEARYNCCDGESNSVGCCTAVCHVHTTKAKDYQKNFICAALEPGNSDTMGTDAWDIIAVDCEMVYTTGGSELARATFVGVDGKILYDTLVKPPRAVLDYNTRYSGIDESMLVNTSTTISDVHLKIMANVKPNSIIIGHSLENDLIALKLIHDTVIDTSVVFPHKRGLPFKRALRNLSADYLGKIIQVGDGGHDSAEDARAALDLMLWKVKNDSSKGLKRSTSVID